jgi:dsRNA-specific ribonuclease
MLSVDRKRELNEFITKLNIEKTDVELLDVALTHPSFNFEKNIDDAPDYERLEFLGDSVLRLVISEILFDKYQTYDEGNLTKIRSYLVSDEFLAKLAEKINYKFIDMDQDIEVKACMFIDEIFQMYGEAYFRALEKNTLKEYQELDNIIISTGGGIVNDLSNKKLFDCQYVKR